MRVKKLNQLGNFSIPDCCNMRINLIVTFATRRYAFILSNGNNLVAFRTHDFDIFAKNNVFGVHTTENCPDNISHKSCFADISTRQNPTRIRHNKFKVFIHQLFKASRIAARNTTVKRFYYISIIHKIPPIFTTPPPPAKVNYPKT